MKIVFIGAGEDINNFHLLVYRRRVTKFSLIIYHNELPLSPGVAYEATKTHLLIL